MATVTGAHCEHLSGAVGLAALAVLRAPLTALWRTALKLQQLATKTATAAPVRRASQDACCGSRPRSVLENPGKAGCID